MKLGFYKNLYEIGLPCGDVFYCFYLSKGSFDYVSVYSDDKQIALIETYLNVNDYKYTHKLYILDNYKEFAEILSLFTLYYANFTFSRRFHMSKTSTYTKAWTISSYDYKYDPQWRETNFPDENFFGKINLFNK